MMRFGPAGVLRFQELKNHLPCSRRKFSSDHAGWKKHVWHWHKIVMELLQPYTYVPLWIPTNFTSCQYPCQFLDLVEPRELFSGIKAVHQNDYIYIVFKETPNCPDKGDFKFRCTIGLYYIAMGCRNAERNTLIRDLAKSVNALISFQHDGQV